MIKELPRLLRRQNPLLKRRQTLAHRTACRHASVYSDPQRRAWVYWRVYDWVLDYLEKRGEEEWKEV